MEGYTIEGESGQYLNKDRTGFIIHSNEHTPYVHKLKDLARCPNRVNWSPKATRATRARFNEGLKLSSKVGEPMNFKDFESVLDALASVSH